MDITRPYILGLLSILIVCDALSAQVNAEFSAPITEACNSLQVSFMDNSSSASGNIVEWHWTLGNVQANKQNPTVIFNEVGTYDICLIAIDDNGDRDTICKPDYIKIYDDPVASFMTNPSEGCTPIVAEFTNTSFSPNGVITELIWDVGGSANLVILNNPDSVLQSTYVASGPYNASLYIVDDKGCSNTINVANAVTVLPAPQAEVSFEVISGCDLPWEVVYELNQVDPSTSYHWTFGNGETYIGSDPPNILYDSLGEYDVTIALDRNGCRDTVIYTGLINPTAAPAFMVTPNGACVNTELEFSDVSQISADSIFWDFGDGNTSTEEHPIHTYSDADCYEVTMIRYVSTCIDTVINPCLEIYDIPDLSYSISNQYSCELPISITLEAQSNVLGNYTWIFKGQGDDRVLYGDSVSILINENGNYSVDLEYISDGGCSTGIYDIPIESNILEAELPFQIISGCSPLSFTLQDSIISDLALASWDWTIIAPSGSTIDLMGPSPSHTLVDTGRYDVQLIVENTLGCQDTILVEDYIRVGIPPEVDFVVTPLEECILSPKTFTAITSDYADEWVWGTDGTDTISIEQNPELYLSNAMTWDISLTAYHNGCPNILIKEDYVIILEPQSNYTIVYNCEDPYTIEINDLVTGADSSYWEIEIAPDVRDTFFNQSITGYTFPDRGKYFIRHYSVNYTTGCEHFRSDTIYITDPIASFSVDTLSGCSPLTIDISGQSVDAAHLDYVIPGATIDSTLTVTDPTLTYTASGTFMGPSLIVTDIHGCADTLNMIDSVLVNTPTANPLFDDGVCIPDSIHMRGASTDRLGTITSQRWYIDGQYISAEDSFYLQVIDPGFIDVSLAVTDDWGCQDSIHMANAIFGSDLNPDFYTPDSSTCTGHAIRFQLTEATTETLAYYWDFGDGTTSTTATPLHAYSDEGNYTVCLTIINTRQCEKTLCKEEYISINDPVANFSGDPLYETCPPLITNFSNNSQHADQFVWDFGDNSGLSSSSDPSHLYNVPGGFTVSLIASSSVHCSDTIVIEDYVVVDGPTGSFEVSTDSSCLPLTVTIMAVADDLYHFAYDYGNGVSGASTGLRMRDTTIYMYEETGAFIPKLILSDENGCTRSFTSEEIVVNDLQLDFATDTDVTCDLPASIQFENLSNSTSLDVDYHWILDGPDEIISSTVDLSVSIDSVGSYQVILIGQSENCIDTLIIDSLVQIGSIPIADFSIISDQACEQILTEFQNLSTNEYGEIISYAWDLGDGTSSDLTQLSHIYMEADDYEVSLSVISEYGCQSSITLPIQVLENTVPVLPEDHTMCIGDSVQILVETIGTGQSETTFSWSDDTYLSCGDCTHPIANPIDTTEYFIYAEHSNGCSSVDSMWVNVVPIPGPQLVLSEDTTICHMDTAMISILNYNPALSYLWDDHPEMGCHDCEIIKVYPEENSYYAVTAINEFGCVKEDSIFVVVERSVDDFLISSKGICQDSMTTLELDNSEMLNPIWSDHQEMLCQDCYTVNVTPNESQYYYLTVDSPLGCTYVDSIYIITVPYNSIVVSDDELICLGEEVELVSQGYGSPEWSPNNSISDPTTAKIIASPVESTVYTISYTLDECIVQDSVAIEVIDKVDISVVGDTICRDDEALLIAQGAVDQFTWYSEDGLYVDTADSLYIMTDMSEQLMVVGTMGLCENDTALVDLVVHPYIDVELLKRSYRLYINTAEYVDIEYNESDNYSYLWTPSEGLSCNDCPDPRIADLTSDQEYILRITDLDSGCYQEEQIWVRLVSDCSEKAFYIPNIFSPNHDGSNDNFFIRAEDPREFNSIQIYDRWGTRVYYSEDINQTWDGYMFGRPLLSGVYPYRIDYTCLDTGDDYTFYGDITIIR